MEELLKEVTGEPLNPVYYTDYLKRKYGGLYEDYVHSSQLLCRWSYLMQYFFLIILKGPIPDFPKEKPLYVLASHKHAGSL